MTSSTSELLYVVVIVLRPFSNFIQPHLPLNSFNPPLLFVNIRTIFYFFIMKQSCATRVIGSCPIDDNFFNNYTDHIFATFIPDIENNKQCSCELSGFHCSIKLWHFHSWYWNLPTYSKASPILTFGLRSFLFSENHNWDDEETMSGLTFLGFVGIEETVRSQVTRGIAVNLHDFWVKGKDDWLKNPFTPDWRRVTSAVMFSLNAVVDIFAQRNLCWFNYWSGLS